MLPEPISLMIVTPITIKDSIEGTINPNPNPTNPNSYQSYCCLWDSSKYLLFYSTAESEISQRVAVYSNLIGGETCLDLGVYQ